MERSGQLGIYFEDRANRIFDSLHVSVRGKGVKDHFLKGFSQSSWMNRDATSRGKSLLLGKRDQEFVLSMLSLRCLLDIQVQMQVGKEVLARDKI